MQPQKILLQKILTYNNMAKSAKKQTLFIALATLAAIALFATTAAAGELSQDEIDRIMSLRAAPYRESLEERDPLPPGMIYLDDGTPYILEDGENIPQTLSPEEVAEWIKIYTSPITPKWETPAPALETTLPAKFVAPQRADIWSRYLKKPQALERMGVINSGVIIPAMLLTGLNSDLPGYLIAQVSEPVYDSPTGTALLIPQGSRLFGEYDSKVIFGQRRPLIKWSRLIFPDGSILDMENMPGSDKRGYAGFKASVNNHYLPMFGSAVMISVFAGLAEEYGKNETSVTISQPRVVLGDTELVGTIKGWSTDTAPIGYLMCDGKEFDEALYPDLKALLGDAKTPDYNSKDESGIKWIIRARTNRSMSYSSGSNVAVVDEDGNEIVNEIAESLSEMAERLLSKYLDMAPTLKVKPAYRFSVIVNKELLLPVRASL